MHNKKVVSAGILIIAGLIASALDATSARATEILTVSDGQHTQTIAGDGTQGLVFNSLLDPSWASSSWNISIAVGAGSPLIGTPDSPELHLGVVGTGIGTLTVSLFEDGFSRTFGPAVTQTQAGGVTGGTVSVTSSLGADTLSAFGPWSDTAFSETAYSTPTLDGAYSLDLTTTITQATQAATSVDASVTVPEPGTLALFGAALLGCALFVGRSRTKAIAA